MSELIDGKKVSEDTRAEIAQGIEELKSSSGITPGLAAVLVGDDPASEIYVRNKRKACEKVGIYSEEHKLPAETTEEELLELVNKLNNDDKIHGILVQLPLPDHLNEQRITALIDPGKDVDGLHPYNLGLLVLSRPALVPCTPQGVMRILEHYDISPKGKRAVIVGRSFLVGRPLALLLGMKGTDATVTMAHSRTVDLPEVTREADILVAAVGRPQMINARWGQPGATVVDVGINRTDEGLVGDVDFDAVAEVAGAITPVPGGVGPMTVAMLMKNTVTAAERRMR
jgi:methylenetetrahydrofolate dehydrogenase (NADP+)/methenyltetrahydrofolate cyclohydrolase